MSWLIAGLARLVLIGVWIFTPYVARAVSASAVGWLAGVALVAACADGRA